MFTPLESQPGVISTVISVVVQRGLPKVAPKPLAVSLLVYFRKYVINLIHRSNTQGPLKTALNGSYFLNR